MNGPGVNCAAVSLTHARQLVDANAIVRGALERAVGKPAASPPVIDYASDDDDIWNHVV